MRTTIGVTGPADPQTVWERYADPRRWSSWSPQVRHVTPTTRIHRGMRGRVDGVVPFEVLAVDEEARSWSWRAGRWPVRAVLHHAVLPAPGGSRTTLTLDGAPWLVVPYLPLARLALRRLVR